MPIRLACLLALALVLTLSASAQPATGVPPFSTTSGGPDVVNLGNLNVHLSVPVTSKAGRGLPFSYHIAYDSSVWRRVSSGGNWSWQPVANWGWAGRTQVATGYLSYDSWTDTCLDFSGKLVSFTIYHSWVYHDSFGTQHPFDVVSYSGQAFRCDPPYPTEASGVATNGSGYQISIFGATFATITPRDGGEFFPPLQSGSGSGTAQDSNGNRITTDGTTFTDTLGTTALSISGTNPVNFAYTKPGGGSVSVKVHYTTKSVKTNFGCTSPAIAEYGPTNVALVSSVELPNGDTYTFTYEETPGDNTKVTGRMKSVTLPTGGTITYTYSGGNNGIICADGSTAGLTRHISTDNATWSYSRSGSGNQWTTTVTDPTGNQSVLDFQKIYETRRSVYEGTSGSGTLLLTVHTCYNGTAAPCTSNNVNLPISRRTVTTVLPANLQSKNDTYFNTYGLVTRVDEHDFDSGSPGAMLRKTEISYASLGNGIVSRPSVVTVRDGSGNLKAKTEFAYDQFSPTATSGTPQKVSVTGSRGNLTTVKSYKDASNFLTRTFTYFDTGNVTMATDVNSAQTSYEYGACGNSFLTKATLPLSLVREATWNCTGAVITSTKDENNQTTTYTYNDAHFWRLTQVTNAAGAVTAYTYPSTIAVQAALTFNSGNSTVTARVTLDSLGRPILSQRRQSPSSSDWDTVQTDYNSRGLPWRGTQPFVAAAGQTSGTAPRSETEFDPLGRPVEMADAGGGWVTASYAQNTVYRTLGPAPTGENTKRQQQQFDGLGRLTSVCEVTSGIGSGTCSQTVTQTGYWTKYTYDTLGSLTQVEQNAQSGSPQNRGFTYDWLGRLLSETNPETGTTTYTYDSIASGTCAATHNGQLIKRTDAQGTSACYKYDALHRATSITYSGGYASSTHNKYFVYDAATVNGQAMANAKGRLARAFTTAGSDTDPKVTDIGLSYSVLGQVVDAWQWTTNSSGYRRVTASYWEHGALKQLSNLSGLPTITYGMDGQGRPATVSASSGQNPVTGTNYNTASQPTLVTLGSSDTAGYSFDANTGRLTQYQFSVNSQTVTGAVGWNASGSMASLNITNQINSNLSQSCTYKHDDLSRIQEANCGQAWQQTFSFDAFGNVSKSGSISFQPTYNPATNRISTIPGAPNPGYDSVGNLTSITADAAYSYSWDGEGRPVSVTRDSTTVTLTYDAFGRMAEQNRSGVRTQIIYGPTGGKLALMNGTTLLKAFVPLPAGQAVYTSSGLSHYRYHDWLGSSRLASTPSRTVYAQGSYAPYGEPYFESGTQDRSFTGQEQDTVSGLYDFMFREFHAVQGRWTSPDPLGIAAGSLAVPQSLNLYAYVMNQPLRFFDRLGLCAQDPEFDITVCADGAEVPLFDFGNAEARVKGFAGGSSGAGDGPGGRVGGGPGGGTPTAPAQSPEALEPTKNERLERAKVCAQAYYNLPDYTGVASRAGLVAAGAPVLPKSWFGPTLHGTSRVTNVLSAAGHFAPIQAPFSAFGTTNLLRMAGRVALPVAVGMLVADAVAIGVCTFID